MPELTHEQQDALALALLEVLEAAQAWRPAWNAPTGGEAVKLAAAVDAYEALERRLRGVR